MIAQSPYLEFSRTLWREFRRDTPLTLSEKDLAKLKGQNESVSLAEVEDIYLPLSRLLNLYVVATQDLYHVTTRFLGHPEPKVPYIIGVAGSVAVGKSTTSRILQALLSHWPNHRNVALVTTDGFLYSNAELGERGLLNRKGFPESYDIKQLINFLQRLKSGESNLQVPIYSHHHYDIVSGEYQVIEKADIVIVEGLNVLQTASDRYGKQPLSFVSDFFDFSIYVDAQTHIIEKWFLDRFMLFRDKARNDPDAFFYQFTQMKENEALQFAQNIWSSINELNLVENILPYKNRANLVLQKGQDHFVEKVYLRKL
jgi:type I pantothenate kinase